jgi:hypothetical protein
MMDIDASLYSQFGALLVYAASGCSEPAGRFSCCSEYAQLCLSISLYILFSTLLALAMA